MKIYRTNKRTSESITTFFREKMKEKKEEREKERVRNTEKAEQQTELNDYKKSNYTSMPYTVNKTNQ